jgi:glycosyltransferase involved in cell wall biosynthesis
MPLQERKEARAEGLVQEAELLDLVEDGLRERVDDGGQELMEDVHLLLVGDGEGRGALERQVAARGLRATFTGHVAPAEVPDLIASMDLLVHPSIWEGLPRAAVQALLVGRPVVAFDCDGAREVVIDGVTGRLAPAKSVSALRSAIEDILRLPDRGRS